MRGDHRHRSVKARLLYFRRILITVPCVPSSPYTRNSFFFFFFTPAKWVSRISGLIFEVYCFTQCFKFGRAFSFWFPQICTATTMMLLRKRRQSKTKGIYLVKSCRSWVHQVKANLHQQQWIKAALVVNKKNVKKGKTGSRCLLLMMVVERESATSSYFVSLLQAVSSSWFSVSWSLG